MSARGNATRALVAGAVFAGVALAVRSGQTDDADRDAARVVSARTPEPAKVAAATLTDLGSAYAVVGVSLVAWMAHGVRAAVRVFGAGMGAWIVGQTAKRLVDRTRPYQRGWAPRTVSIPHGTSFPSGHAAVAAGLATALPMSPAARAALVLTVAWSRIVVGVHHPTDVIAGSALGVSFASLWTQVVR